MHRPNESSHDRSHGPRLWRISSISPESSAFRRRRDRSSALRRFRMRSSIDDLNGCGIQHEFVDQPQAVLARYFDDQLVRLWLADLQCAARARAICNLDFSPIWNSQDPVGTVVRNLQVRQPNVHREMHTQMHTLKKTKHCICTEVESSQFSRLNWNPGLPRWMRAANVSRTQPVV